MVFLRNWSIRVGLWKVRQGWLNCHDHFLAVRLREKQDLCQDLPCRLLWQPEWWLPPRARPRPQA